MTSERRCSLSTLFAALGASLAILAALVAAGLVWSSHELRSASEAIGSETASMAAADDLMQALLAHSRTLTIAVDGDPDAVREERRAMRERIPVLLARARELAGTPDELALLDDVEQHVARYLVAAVVVDSLTGRGGVRAVHDTRRPANDALRTLVELRATNAAGVQRAYARAETADARSTTMALVAATLVLFTVLVLGITLRAWVLQPLHRLREAVADYHATRSASGFRVDAASEIAGLGDALGSMSDALAREHELRLALTAGIAHDLRNPLSPLKTGASLLARDPSIAASTTARRTLAILDRQLDQLDRMITDLLDSARIEAGQLELRAAPIDVREAVRDAVELHGTASERHSITLDLPDEPVVAVVDRVRLEQVVGNLLSNAIKYSPQGGPVRVALRAVERDAVLTVADRGIGIAAGAMADLFTPFLRRPDARAVAPGAGLGLSVVRRIVEAHGGTIEVESTVGSGSTFRVRLPLAADTAAAEPASEPGGGPRAAPAT